VIGDEHGNLTFVVAYHQTHVMNADVIGIKVLRELGDRLNSQHQRGQNV
jgi:hypothetical protein